MLVINDVPLLTRTPGTYAKVDNSNAVQGLLPWPQRVLLLGQLCGDRVINGAFDADSDWVKGTGWSISGGAAACSGAQTAETSLSQDVGASKGVIYKIKFKLSGGTIGVITPKLGGKSGTPITAASGNGDHEIELECGSSNTLLEFVGDADYTGSIDDISCVEKATKAENSLSLVPSAEAAELYYGPGSQITRMIKKFKAINSSLELWACPQGDGNTRSKGLITVTGPATSGGSIHLMIAGDKVSVAVDSGDTADAIATAVKAAINENPFLPVYATALAGVVTVWAKSIGLDGNFIDMRVNYNNGEVTAPGVGVTITAIGAEQASSANPSLSSAIAAMGDERFDYIITPYTDNTNMGLLEVELDRRFGPMVQIEGIAFSAVKDTYSNLATWADDNQRNSQHMNVFGYDDSPASPSEWAAVYGANVSYEANIDPARPFQTLPLRGILPPLADSAARLTREERNILLWNGLSTWKVDAGGNVVIERSITNYRKGPVGTPDPSYLDTNTLTTLMYVRYQFRSRMELRFSRHKLVDDDSIIAPGQAVVRPKDIKAETIALCTLLANQGIIEDLATLKKELVVERDANDPNRVNLMLPANLVNQFRVLAAIVQFIL